MTVNLLGICGSSRAASVNRKLMQVAASSFGPADFIEADLRLPLYDGDLEDRGTPAEVIRLIDQIIAADAVIIASPEYNQSFSGVLKNALDWVSRSAEKPWLDKPVAIVSAAAGRTGGARGQYALRLAMAPFRCHLIPGPEVLVAAAAKQFDENGQLVSERYQKGLTELMDQLRAAALSRS